MRQFFKIFFATLAALIVFTIISFVISIVVMMVLSSAASKGDVKLNNNSVLLLDLNQTFQEQTKENISISQGFSTNKIIGMYDAVRMINFAATDKKIKGIYIKADNNPNGFATSHELRTAIENFRKSKKFVIAYATSISQKAYYVASAADKVYLHSQGMMEWKGLSTNVMFFKKALDKLEIKPEIFFAGKYKSATEPFRVTEMTTPNKEQTAAWLNDLNDVMVAEIAASRHIDTATLRGLANNFTIQQPQDAVNNKLVDGLRYNDELQTEIRKLLSIEEKEKLNLVSLEKYHNNDAYKKQGSGKDEIALLYAQGNIMEAGNNGITSTEYVKLLRKIRLNDDIKALVFRVNSPGGSALASDEIWREILLMKQKKPVVVSMGDVAASGGYYISCAANKVFADANTITGSIGVFAIFGNLENFFKNKLGITFDGVKTAPYADFGNFTRNMTDGERSFFQNFVDTTYNTFKSRVAAGRNKSVAYIDSIAQGHVWSGITAKSIGLVDEIGSLQDALAYTASLIKAKDYKLREYPKTESIYEKLLNMTGDKDNDLQKEFLQKQFGSELVNIYTRIYTLGQMMNTPQAMLPYTFDIR